MAIEDDPRPRDDDRPVRRRNRSDRDFDDDRQKSNSGGIPVWVWILVGVGGVSVLACAGVLAVFWTGARAIQKEVHVQQDRFEAAQAAQAAKAAETLNPPTVTDPDRRVELLDLLFAYRKSPEDADKKYGGKKYLIDFAGECFDDAEGKPAILYDSQGGFKAPPVAARLSNRKGYKPGALRDHYYVEGTIIGPVPLTTPWLRKWANLPPASSSIEGKVVVIEDAMIVPKPKN